MPSGGLRLNSCNYHRIENIIFGTSPTQVVYRLVEALQNRSNSQRSGFALHCFVGVVSGIEIRENKNRGPTGNRGVG